jgi:uncharacterized protein YjbJ (UPF0337 family)
VGDSSNRYSKKGADDERRRQDRERGREGCGQGERGVGDATDNERLQAEGKGDRVKADLKQAGENIKDAFKK